MCNEQHYSESGAPIAPTRCEDYQLIFNRLGSSNRYISTQQDKIDALEQENARLLEALRRVGLFSSRSNSSRADPWTILADIEDYIGNALKEVGGEWE